MPEEWTPSGSIWPGHHGTAEEPGYPGPDAGPGYPPAPTAYPGTDHPYGPGSYPPEGGAVYPDGPAYPGGQGSQWPAGPDGPGAPTALAGYGRGPGDGYEDRRGPRRPRRRGPLLVAAAVALVLLAVVAIIVLPGHSGNHKAAAGQQRAGAAGTAGNAKPSSPGQAGGPTPAFTLTGAEQVLSQYVAANNQANRAFSASQLSRIEGGVAYRMDADGYVFTANAIKMGTAQTIPDLAFTHPTYYIPRLTGYPRWFVTSGTWTDLTGRSASASGYLLFKQASAGASWLMVNEPNFTGTSAPQITTSGGYAQAVTSTNSPLAVPLASVPQDTSTWLDGTHQAGVTLTGIGTLQDLHDQAFWQSRLPAGTTDSLKHTAYPGDVYALATSGGGALIFYGTTGTLTLDPATSVEIPGYHTPGGASTAVVPYADMFAAYDPPHGQPASIRITAEASGI